MGGTVAVLQHLDAPFFLEVTDSSAPPPPFAERRGETLRRSSRAPPLSLI